jgi:hypothetical protein
MEMPNALDAYLSAVQKFQECAAPILENLIKVREAYEEALQASAEIQQILTSQDDVLGSVMVKLRDTVSQHLVSRSEPKKLIPMFPRDGEEEVTALLRHVLEDQSELGDDEAGGEASAAPAESGAHTKKPAATDEKTTTAAPSEAKKKAV